MTPQRFKAMVAKEGTRTFIAIPFDPNEVWGVKQRHHITGSVNGCAVRGSLGSDGRKYFLPLGAAWRRLEGGWGHLDPLIGHRAPAEVHAPLIKFLGLRRERCWTEP